MRQQYTILPQTGHQRVLRGGEVVVGRCRTHLLERHLGGRIGLRQVDDPGKLQVDDLEVRRPKGSFRQHVELPGIFGIPAEDRFYDTSAADHRFRDPDSVFITRKGRRVRRAGTVLQIETQFTGIGTLGAGLIAGLEQRPAHGGLQSPVQPAVPLWARRRP